MLITMLLLHSCSLCGKIGYSVRNYRIFSTNYYVYGNMFVIYCAVICN